jgi:hypothetical protein
MERYERVSCGSQKRRQGREEPRHARLHLFGLTVSVERRVAAKEEAGRKKYQKISRQSFQESGIRGTTDYYRKRTESRMSAVMELDRKRKDTTNGDDSDSPDVDRLAMSFSLEDLQRE